MDANSTNDAPHLRSPLIAEMVGLSRRLGADTEFVRAGGGNSSAKVDGVLYIKPSGVPLAALTEDSLIALAIQPLRDVLDDRGGAGPGAGSDEVLRVARAARVPPIDERRPSVELLFHALLPEPIVLHTHPTTVNVLTCSVGAEHLARQVLGERIVWIPYTDPGLPLARAIRDARDTCERHGGKSPRAVLLQNHGLIVSGSEAREIEALSREIVAAIAGFVAGRPAVAWGAVERIERPVAREIVEALLTRIGERLSIDRRPGAVAFDGSTLALNVAGSELGRGFATGGPLTPDQIVYAGSWPLLLPIPPVDGSAAVRAFEDALAERLQRGLEPPIIVLVAGVGLFAVGGSAGQAEIARTLFVDAMRIAEGAHRLGGIRPLGAADRRFIEHWEAEAYRKTVARSSW